MSKNKPPKARLGRGLSSLIPDHLEITTVDDDGNPTHETPAAHAPSSREVEIPPQSQLPNPTSTSSPQSIALDAIRPNPHQPRHDFDPARLAELAASIKAAGVIQPVIVRQTPDGYELIAGERRLRAARIAGLTEIPAIVRSVDRFTQAQLALIENIQREDLNPIDRATGYQTLMRELGLTQAELATRLGEDRSSIANHLRLLDLPDDIQGTIRAGRLSLGHAKLIAGIPDKGEQLRLADLVVAQELSVRNLEKVLQAPAATTPTRAAPPVSAHLMDLEQSIARQLGMRVQLRAAAGKGRGRLVIHFSNLDQFDDLMSRLGIAPADS